MAKSTLASQTVASRLKQQEEDIRWLWGEVQRLREDLQDAPDRCLAEGPCLRKEVEHLRSENRHLRYRLDRLRMAFGEELIYQAKAVAKAAAAGAPAPGAQPPPGEGQEQDSEKKKEEEEEEERELSVEERKQRRFIQDSMKLFKTLKEDGQLLFSICQNEEDTKKVISVTVADGKTVQGEVWKTTPHQVASEIR